MKASTPARCLVASCAEPPEAVVLDMMITAGSGSKSILLIRHGETPGNAERIVQTPETPLSTARHCPSQASGPASRRAGIARIVPSDLGRATMTAEYLRTSTGFPSVRSAAPRAELRSLRGTPYDRLTVDIFAPATSHRRERAGSLPRAGRPRLGAHAAGWRPKPTGHLAVITHGLVCRSLAARHLISRQGRTRRSCMGEHRAHDRRRPDGLARAPAQLQRSPRRRPRRPRERHRSRLTRHKPVTAVRRGSKEAPLTSQRNRVPRVPRRASAPGLEAARSRPA